MDRILKTSLMVVLFAITVAIATAEAEADPVTFNTSGSAFSISSSNVVVFSNANGTTTLTFNPTSNSVNTPAGVSFGDIVVTTTVAPGATGPAVGGVFFLNILQLSPISAGGTFFGGGVLSGTLGFDTGVATLSFANTSTTIFGFTYTVNPVYTIALPVTGVGGGAGTGTTTIQGTVTGSGPAPSVPEPGSMLLLATGLAGFAGAVQRYKRARLYLETFFSRR